MTKYTPDSKSERHLPLNKKIDRIAQSLANSSLRTPSNADARLEYVPEGVASAAIRAWKSRGEYLPSGLFSDPAWGMLLELFHAELECRRISLAALCKASAVSRLSAIRWLEALENRDLVIRLADADGSESVELTPNGSAAIRRYFHEVVQRPSSAKGES
jgi:hypothetical protein